MSSWFYHLQEAVWFMVPERPQIQICKHPYFFKGTHVHKIEIMPVFLTYVLQKYFIFTHRYVYSLELQIFNSRIYFLLLVFLWRDWFLITKGLIIEYSSLKSWSNFSNTSKTEKSKVEAFDNWLTSIPLVLPQIWWQSLKAS